MAPIPTAHYINYQTELSLASWAIPFSHHGGWVAVIKVRLIWMLCHTGQSINWGIVISTTTKGLKFRLRWIVPPKIAMGRDSWWVIFRRPAFTCVVLCATVLTRMVIIITVYGWVLISSDHGLIVRLALIIGKQAVDIWLLHCTTAAGLNNAQKSEY